VPFQRLLVPVQNSAALRLFPEMREGQLQILRFALDDSGVLLSTGISCLFGTDKSVPFQNMFVIVFLWAGWVHSPVPKGEGPGEPGSMCGWHWHG
jgi:hypothetical protein